ncbi:MAG: hypothetical protein ACRYHQ_13415 [Janthinobacterium lividum]
MSADSFDDRLKASGLTFPEAEVANLRAFVEDLDRAAAFVRSVERSYAEEPSNVFRLTPAMPGGKG